MDLADPTFLLNHSLAAGVVIFSLYIAPSEIVPEAIKSKKDIRYLGPIGALSSIFFLFIWLASSGYIAFFQDKNSTVEEFLLSFTFFATMLAVIDLGAILAIGIYVTPQDS